MTATTIDGLDAWAYTIPTDEPESDGTLEWDATTMVAVRAYAGGAHGIGYTYAAAPAAALIGELLERAVRGLDAHDVQRAWGAMVAAVRNVGRAGLASCAISAVDVALWDLKARLLRVPLVDLLGSVRDSVPVYGSGGFTSYDASRLRDQLGGWIRDGIGAVKMKVGRDPEADTHRVAVAREAIGPTATLMVDANGAYDAKQALGLADRFRELGVAWFEEPVSSDHLAGLRLLRERVPAPMEVAAGEYLYTADQATRMLEAGAVDVLQADATRCGGITGFLQIAALCDARSMPMSTHTAPALHAALGCSVRAVRHVEYFHDHVRVERMLLDGAPLPQDGQLTPNRDRPGIGFELDEAAGHGWLAAA
jgi:L-alanine-DL-glutamate epimerase-like enolase superfamily enzyme